MVYAFVALALVALGAFYAIIRLSQLHMEERRTLLAMRTTNPELNFAMADTPRAAPAPPRDAATLASIGQIVPGDFFDDEEQ